MKTTTGYLVLGCRPEEIKFYPVKKALGCKSVWTNQSPDLRQGLMSHDFEVSLNNLSAFLSKNRPEWIMVQGDTRTALYGALKAFECGIPVIHLEAGLRSWDLGHPYPEEGYRRMISEIASIHFCPTIGAANNLQGKQNVYVVGQTGIDTLREFAPKPTRGDYAVCTFHRREADIERIVNELKKVDMPLKIFAHPNEQGQKLKKHFKCLEPLPYKEFVKVLAGCRAIITDSGGLQEEAPYLNKPLVIVRETTERPEVLETGASVLAPYDIAEALSLVLYNEHSFSPFGDGVASKLIACILKQKEQNEHSLGHQKVRGKPDG